MLVFFFFFNVGGGGGETALLIFHNVDLRSRHLHLSVRLVVLNSSYVGGNDHSSFHPTVLSF